VLIRSWENQEKKGSCELGTAMKGKDPEVSIKRPLFLF
jgi:hypothetical protein